MKAQTSRFGWTLLILFVISLVATLMLASGWLSGSAANASGDDVDPEVGNHYHAADLDGDGRFTDQGAQWPPRPDGASPLVLVPEASLGADESTSFEVQIALTDPNVAAAIGDRWSVTAVESGVAGGKGEVDPTKSLVQFFSRTNNQTVTATISAGAVTSVEITAPTAFQPDMSEPEKRLAVELARSYWLDQGATDITDLQGFVIRAFTADEQYYGVRMAYVSFHVDEDHVPVYIGNVDLTNETVSDQRVDS